MFDLTEIIGIVAFWVILYLIHNKISLNRPSPKQEIKLSSNRISVGVVDVCYLISVFLVLFLSLTKTEFSIASGSDFTELQIVGFGFLTLILLTLAVVRREGV